MTFRVATQVAIPLCLALVSGVAGAACTPVAGTVRLAPDALCKVAGESPVKVGFTGQCYSVQLRLAGFPAATGHAGLTSETVVSMIPDGGAAATPAFVPQAGTQAVPRQVIQTARTVVTLGQRGRATTLYTDDVIVMQMVPTAAGLVPGAVTEQIVIRDTDKKGAYANVTGHLTVLGNSIDQNAPVVGQICSR